MVTAATLIANDLRRQDPAQVMRVIRELPDEQALALWHDWRFWARKDQLLPSGDWVYWFIKAGRGWGKTRVGSETVRIWVRDFPLVNLIGATADDARDIMIEGESGILAICPHDERPIYIKSQRKLKWPNGAVSLIFTADEPERLRGKQHMKLWCDELPAWRYEESWDQAKFGLRLGAQPQAIITSTPRPTKQVKELMTDPATIVTNGTTNDNRDNLATAFINIITKKYEGTRLGRQELEGEVLDDNPNALFKRSDIDADRVTPEWLIEQIEKGKIQLERVVVGVDPNASSTEGSDECGIVIAALATHQDGTTHGYCLDDLSAIYTPNEWGRTAVTAYHDRDADLIVGEVNNGGDMVESTIRNVDDDVAFKKVHASRAKITRAEPIGALSEQHRLHHVGIFATLEDQLCEYDPVTWKTSPDRLDAYVWAFTELFGKDPSAGITGFYSELNKEEKRKEKGTAHLKPRVGKPVSSDPKRQGLHFPLIEAQLEDDDDA